MSRIAAFPKPVEDFIDLFNRREGGIPLAKFQEHLIKKDILTEMFYREGINFATFMDGVMSFDDYVLWDTFAYNTTELAILKQCMIIVSDDDNYVQLAMNNLYLDTDRISLFLGNRRNLYCGVGYSYYVCSDGHAVPCAQPVAILPVLRPLWYILPRLALAWSYKLSPHYIRRVWKPEHYRDYWKHVVAPRR